MLFFRLLINLKLRNILYKGIVAELLVYELCMYSFFKIDFVKGFLFFFNSSRTSEKGKLNLEEASSRSDKADTR